MKYLPETVQLLLLVIVAPFYFAISGLLLAYNQFRRFRRVSPSHLTETTTGQRVPCNVLITGSSRGFGKALALKYAAEGAEFIALHGRDREALEQVKKQVEKAGAEAEFAEIDVRDQENMEKWVSHINEKHPLDLVIANAGTSTTLLRRKGEYHNKDKFANFEATVRDLFKVNIDGVLNTILPAVGAMTKRHKQDPDFQGQIAVVSSLASWTSIGLYASSKVCIRSLVEGLRPRLKQYNIAMNVICPGFMKSEMTEHRRTTPFILSADNSADIAFYGLLEDKPHIAFPFVTHALCWLYSVLPYGIQDRVMDALDIANRDPSGELILA